MSLLLSELVRMQLQGRLAGTLSAPLVMCQKIMAKCRDQAGNAGSTGAE